MPVPIPHGLDQASEALLYNQDILQTALSQMDQGVAVFDSSDRLAIWNRRFPQSSGPAGEQVGQVGYPLRDIIDLLAERGTISEDDTANMMARIQTFDTPFSLVLRNGERVIEIRSNAMPDQGIVATFTDMTERMAAAEGLAASQ